MLRSVKLPSGIILLLSVIAMLMATAVHVHAQTADDAENIEGVDGDSFWLAVRLKIPLGSCRHRRQIGPSTSPTLAQPQPIDPQPQPVVPLPGDGNRVADTYLWLARVLVPQSGTTRITGTPKECRIVGIPRSSRAGARQLD